MGKLYFYYRKTYNLISPLKKFLTSPLHQGVLGHDSLVVLVKKIKDLLIKLCFADIRKPNCTNNFLFFIIF